MEASSSSGAPVVSSSSSLKEWGERVSSWLPKVQKVAGEVAREVSEGLSSAGVSVDLVYPDYYLGTTTEAHPERASPDELQRWVPFGTDLHYITSRIMAMSQPRDASTSGTTISSSTTTTTTTGSTTTTPTNDESSSTISSASSSPPP
eukprot:scaffold1889_cov33-Attheya_sp.AAC.2